MQENHYLVPTQHDGQEKDIAHTITTQTIEDSEDWFVDAKERLLDVNNWKKLSGLNTIDFKLTDASGRITSRRARKGDYVRIDVGGKGYEVDGGFNWAEIEAIEYDDYPDIGMETFAIRLRPGGNPAVNTGSDNQTYIYDSEATSTFVIGRIGKILSAHYHGRNEDSDMEHHSGGVAVATCAWLGLTDVACEALVVGFIE